MGRPEAVPEEAILRQVLDAVAEAEKATSLDDLNSIFQPVLSKLGFCLFAGVEISNPRAHTTVELIFGEGVEPWWSDYRRMGYAADDPMVKECMHTLDSFFWSDVIARKALSEKEYLIIDDARAHGLRDGFVAPLHKSDGSMFVVLFAGQDCDSQNFYTRATGNLFASHYGMFGRRLSEWSHLHSRPTVPLTARQVECLLWAREGKSSKDIGDILGISEDVVDEHISRACKRIGVRTRVQAIIAAVMEGYFT